MTATESHTSDPRVRVRQGGSRVSGRPLSRGQLALLRAVAAGNVAWRYHRACGWAIRRRDVRSGGRGGGMGARVNTARCRPAGLGLV
jgi:hypothetical protein